MKDYRTNFIHYYHNELKFTDEFLLMEGTVEDSPWHREKNVAVHTDMVVSQYISTAPQVWSKRDLLGALACAFHDFGKPAAEEVKFSEERGKYRRYVGHEVVSARVWESFVDGCSKILQR
jgi:hypothetical protein